MKFENNMILKLWWISAWTQQQQESRTARGKGVKQQPCPTEDTDARREHTQARAVAECSTEESQSYRQCTLAFFANLPRRRLFGIRPRGHVATSSAFYPFGRLTSTGRRRISWE